MIADALAAASSMPEPTSARKDQTMTTDATTAALLAAITDLTAKVEALESAPTKRTGRKVKAAPTEGTEASATLTEGTRPGYLQLAFGGKPTDAVRATLKAHGVRFAPSTKAWYGTNANVRAALKVPKAKIGSTVTFR